MVALCRTFAAEANIACKSAVVSASYARQITLEIRQEGHRTILEGHPGFGMDSLGVLSINVAL